MDPLEDPLEGSLVPEEELVLDATDPLDPPFTTEELDPLDPLDASEPVVEELVYLLVDGGT